jgi:uncharacterized Fe-S cluster-containing MiaB family protein
MVKLSLCLMNYALCHEHIWDSGGIAPPFLTSAVTVVKQKNRPNVSRHTVCKESEYCKNLVLYGHRSMDNVVKHNLVNSNMFNCLIP